MAKISLLIACTQRLFQEALGAALRARPDFEVLESMPGSGLMALRAADEAQPDVALADFSLPDMEGTALARLIKHRAPAAKVILLSWILEGPQVQQALRAGASGLLPAAVTVDELAEEILRAHAGRPPILGKSPSMTTSLQAVPGEDEQLWRGLVKLTPREIEILGLLSFGPLESVAELLSVSPRTIQTHLYRIMKKTGARSQTEVINLACRFGLIAVD